MEKVNGNNYRCFWNHYPNHEPVWMCTTDKKDWFEKVDPEEAIWQSGLCIVSVVVGQPAGCISYAKWFADSVQEIFK